MNQQTHIDGTHLSHIPNPGLTNENPKDIGFWALVIEDYATHGHDIFAQGFWVLFWHRFGNWRMYVRPRALRIPLSLLYKVMFKLCEWFCGIMLPYTTYVGRRVKLEHFGGMVLVAQAIGNDVIIRQNTTFGIARTKNRVGRPIIGDHVDIGAGAVIIGQISVGTGSTIGANAVVTKTLPAHCVAVGVPARVLKSKPA
jgi:serine O-acetyltransferase